MKTLLLEIYGANLPLGWERQATSRVKLPRISWMLGRRDGLWVQRHAMGHIEWVQE